MYKWLEYKPNTSVKNNFGMKWLASKVKLIVGLVGQLKIDINKIRKGRDKNE